MTNIPTSDCRECKNFYANLNYNRYECGETHEVLNIYAEVGCEIPTTCPYIEKAGINNNDQPE